MNPTNLRRTMCVAIPLLGAAMACGRADPARPDVARVLFLTDFGARDGAVALCKGVMWEIEPTLRIVDVTHEIPPYDVETAGEVLEQTLAYYPSGTVAVAVVDPGVGGQRKGIAILTKRGHLLVGPDNGLFTLVLESEGLDRAVELRNKTFQRPGDAAYTFHGRDIFSPVAAHLAAGAPLDSLGPPIVPFRLDVRAARQVNGGIAGIVRYIEDPYGNVVTNIPPALLDSAGFHVGDSLETRIGARAFRLPWRNTFSDVPRGALVAVMHERALLSVSINQGDFASKYGVRSKDSVIVRRVQ